LNGAQRTNPALSAKPLLNQDAQCQKSALSAKPPVNSLRVNA